MAKDTDQTSTHDTHEKKGIKLTPKEIVGLIVLVLVAIFCAQNTQDAKIAFFGGDFTSPLWVILLAVLAIGVLVGLVLPYGRGRKKG
jgi:uncharacterized integral membrane protein